MVLERKVHVFPPSGPMSSGSSRQKAPGTASACPAGSAHEAPRVPANPKRRPAAAASPWLSLAHQVPRAQPVGHRAVVAPGSLGHGDHLGVNVCAFPSSRGWDGFSVIFPRLGDVTDAERIVIVRGLFLEKREKGRTRPGTQSSLSRDCKMHRVLHVNRWCQSPDRKTGTPCPRHPRSGHGSAKRPGRAWSCTCPVQVTCSPSAALRFEG